jgi:multisubunit Na+/H+ antiporter MnhB subunit
MRPAHWISFLLALLSFLIVDFVLNIFCGWLRSTEETVAYAFFVQLLVPFVPLVAAGLVAGYLGAPDGCMIAFLAVLVGGLISMLVRYGGAWELLVSDTNNTASYLGWALGSALAGAIAGRAGESLR